jgi:hypothetical protein
METEGTIHGKKGALLVGIVVRNTSSADNPHPRPACCTPYHRSPLPPTPLLPSFTIKRKSPPFWNALTVVDLHLNASV